MERFCDWFVVREWEFIGGKEPPPPPPTPSRPPSIDSNPTIMMGPDQTMPRLLKLYKELEKVDPRRAKWFMKMVSMPGNAQRLDRLANQITNVQDLLRLIGKLEVRQRANHKTVIM